MAKLNLSVAVGDYDRTRALIDGAVQIDGVDPVYMTLVPEEIFFRAFRAAEFDICELSMSSYTVKTAQGNCPYIAVPAFVSRAFRHTSVYVRTDRVKKPQDLRGRKVGVPEYQLTANVWARAFLEDDYGAARIRRHRRLHRAAAADAGRKRPSAYRLAVPRSSRGGEGLFQAHRLFPDHARGRRAPRTGRAPSVAARRGAQSLRAVQACGLGETVRHLGHQGDAAVRRGAPRRSARAYGRRFLVLRRRAEPQGARLFFGAASRRRLIGAQSRGRRAVSPGDV